MGRLSQGVDNFRFINQVEIHQRLGFQPDGILPCSRRLWQLARRDNK